MADQSEQLRQAQLEKEAKYIAKAQEQIDNEFSKCRRFRAGKNCCRKLIEKIWWTTDEEYKQKFKWDRSYFIKDQCTLQTIRIFMLVFQFFWLATELAWNKSTDFIFYYTSWGMVWTDLALLSSIKAVKYPQWHTAACIINQVAHCLNIIITILFWVVLAPMIYSQLDWHKFTDAFIGLYMFFLHVQPFIFTTVNILISDVELIHDDYRVMFVAGVVYTICNLIGTITYGKPIYPVADWKNPLLTLVMYLTMSVAQTYLYYKFCDFVQWYRKKVKPTAAN